MNPTRRDVLAGLAATALTGSGAQAAPSVTITAGAIFVALAAGFLVLAPSLLF